MTDRTAFIRRSPREVFLGVRQIPGDLCTAPGFISFSPLSLAYKCDWCVAWDKWSLVRNPDRRGWHRPTSMKFFDLSLWFNWQQATSIITGNADCNCDLLWLFSYLYHHLFYFENCIVINSSMWLQIQSVIKYFLLDNL